MTIPMRYLKLLIVGCLCLLAVTTIKAQTGKLDTMIDTGIEKYKADDKKTALQIWEKVEKAARDTSSTYGTVLGNILYYYAEEKNEQKLQEYYNRIMNSKLKDTAMRYNQLGEPFRNYRYHATMSMASYYANEKQFATALRYVNIADDKIRYENSSLTAIIYQKVDLAFWKYKLYKDLGKPDSAFYVLLKRAFEYDYKKIYPNWATVSPSNDELELSQAILSDTTKEGMQHFKSELDEALNKLEIKKATLPGIVSFQFGALVYDINVYEHMTSAADYRNYLEQSFFYKYLANKTK